MTRKTTDLLTNSSRRGFIGTTAMAAFGAVGAHAALGATDGATLTLPKKTYKPLPAGGKLRIGVVGGGFGSSFPWHLHPNCEVTAVADLRSDRRDKLKKLFQCDNTYGEFHPMLKDPKVDAVAIYTEPPDHASHCIDVMKAGKHVMCVIPSAITLEDCQKLIDTVKSTGQIYMHGETGCHRPSTRLARDLFKEEKFGRVYNTKASYVHHLDEKSYNYYLIRNGKPTWRYGNPQGFYIGHATGPVIYVTRDRFTEVSAIGTASYRYQQMYKDNQYGNPFINTTFFFKTAMENSSQINIHWETALPGVEAADYYGTKMAFLEPKVSLQQPTARVYFPGQAPETVDASTYDDNLLPPALRAVPGHGGSHKHIINEFVSACLEERKPLVDVFQGVAFSAPGIVGFQSALKGGETLKIPDFGPIS